MRMLQRPLPAAALCLASVLAVTPLAAQQAASGAAPAPSPASIEPAVDTSARPAAPAARPAAPASPAAVPAASPPATGAATRTPAPPPARDAAPRRGPRAMDRVDLEASQITGNRELPRVLYIVPWRAPEAGDVEGRPVNSLLYELTRPVDRDVFRRENRYFDALQSPSPNADAADGAAGPGGPEK